MGIGDVGAGSQDLGLAVVMRWNLIQRANSRPPPTGGGVPEPCKLECVGYAALELRAVTIEWKLVIFSLPKSFSAKHQHTHTQHTWRDMHGNR